MTPILRAPLLLFLCCLAVGGGARTGAAQSLPLTVDVPLVGVTGYAEAVPTPEEVFGHQIGARHTLPHQVVRYFETVARESDRVVYGEHGRTYEGRRLVHAIVTSPANHARLDAIQATNRRLSDAPDGVADDVLTAMPGVVYMGYSVHGNEASGTEAALLLLYHLAAGEGPAVEQVLDSLVVIIDPMLNPDGRDRFADWANRHRGAVPTTDPQHREHNEAWPGGRTNHYFFDLNRDWLLLQHPESQGRMALWHAWRPQVSTDYHEMGSNATYFFQPGIPSRTNPLTPALNQELTAQIGVYHAEELDRVGQFYYTEESFDDFYYGKGSTYPDVNGAVGILFEQASSRALERETDWGVLDYGTTVRNQFLTSLSTLRAAADLRVPLLRFQRDFYREAPERAAESEVTGYVVGLDRGRTRAQRLAQVLQGHRVRLHELSREVTIDGRIYRPGQAYVVPVDQPQTSLVRAAMERTDTFPDSLFYDVSSWTLPLSFDVDHAALRQDVGRLLGGELGAVTLDGGEVVGGQAAYAYLIEPDAYYMPRAVYRLQDAGIRPVLLADPFTAVVAGQRRTFPRGTIAVPVVQQDAPADTVHGLMQTVAEADHVPVYAVSTGLTPTGPDLGSRSAEVLAKPEIAIVTGPGTSTYDAGEVWYLISERFRIPASLLDADAIGRADLDRYAALILAGGSYGDLDADAVRSWVQRGGRLLAFESAVDWVREQGLLDLEQLTVDVDSLVQDLPYADLQTGRGAQVLGGSLFAVDFDTTHPLGYGMPETLPVFLERNVAYTPPETPGATVARFAPEPLLSGYVSDPVLDQLGGTAALVVQRQGRGRVVAFPFNPDFRAFWWGTDRLVLNAILFGSAY